MAKDAATRIADRNDAARKHMEGMDGFSRFVAKIGLGIANTLDRATGWISSNTGTFLGATGQGMVRGMIYGAGIGLVALAAGIVPAAVSAGITFLTPNILFLGTVATLGLACGMYQGQQALTHHLYGNPRTLSDKIAQYLGAVPKLGEAPAPARSVPTIRQSSGPRGHGHAHAQSHGFKISNPAVPVKGRFVEQEEKRRAATKAAADLVSAAPMQY